MQYGDVEVGSKSPSLSPVFGIVLGSLALCVCALWLCAHLPSQIRNDTAIFLYRQDRLLLFVESCLLLLSFIRLRHRDRPLDLPRSALLFMAFALVIVCYAGHEWILGGYDLSRDEQMAVFDSRIFSSGRLVQPLPPAWRGHTDALYTLYMLHASHPVAWVSGYLPMNATMRSLVGLFGDPALTGPLMAALGLIALWNCARLIWPEDREAAIVALVLYVCSGQVLFNGMTAFAMPAHLSLDLVWLWLFLLRKRGADVAALVVGFVATGLHQPLFHPLFVAPILLTLVRDRSWQRLALYVAGYAAISGFWLAWPGWMHTLVADSHSAPAADGTDYFSRLVSTVSTGDPIRWPAMGANLLRFFAWQDALLLPLLLAAIPAMRREPLPAALAASFVLPACAMLVLLSYQGHGFGYRYLHGVLGAGILLAVYGWRHIVAGNSWMRPLLLRTALGAVLVVLPLQAWMANSWYAATGRLDRRVAASGADYFIVGWEDAPFATALVWNRPDLSNRPIRLIAHYLDEPVIRNICHPGVRVALPTGNFLRPIETYYLVPYSTTADERIAALSPRLKAAGCTIDRLDGP
ncbi:MAG TPA: hypothetical protein VHY79_04540 [Rhizomicrobium sp.]|nr:hypothetical protein [Rhizomicrobium sp.]